MAFQLHLAQQCDSSFAVAPLALRPCLIHPNALPWLRAFRTHDPPSAALDGPTRTPKIFAVLESSSNTVITLPLLYTVMIYNCFLCKSLSLLYVCILCQHTEQCHYTLRCSMGSQRITKSRLHTSLATLLIPLCACMCTFTFLFIHLTFAFVPHNSQVMQNPMHTMCTTSCLTHQI